MTPCSAEVSCSLLGTLLATYFLEPLLCGSSTTCLETWGAHPGLPPRGLWNLVLPHDCPLSCYISCGGMWPLNLVQDTHNSRQLRENHDLGLFFCLNTPPPHCYSIVSVGYPVRGCPTKFPDRQQCMSTHSSRNFKLRFFIPTCSHSQSLRILCSSVFSPSSFSQARKGFYCLFVWQEIAITSCPKTYGLY